MNTGVIPAFSERGTRILRVLKVDLLFGKMENDHRYRNAQAGKEFLSLGEPQTDQSLVRDVEDFQAIDPVSDLRQPGKMGRADSRAVQLS